MNKLLLTFSLVLFIFFSGFSQQIQKNFYQTFEVKDEVGTLKFNFPCKVEYRKTSNQKAMIETFVTWTTGNYQLLEVLIKEGEYNTLFETSPLGVSFGPTKAVQNEIGLKDGRIIKATLNVIVFLPENFFQERENVFSRCSDDRMASSSSKNDMKLK